MVLLRAAVALCCAIFPPTAFAAEEEEDRVAFGQELFEQNWLRPPADDSPLATPRRGDGLGPLFNGVSCVECHHLGGTGGAGSNESNVEIVSLALPLGTPRPTIRTMALRAGATHPGFRDNTNVFLHRFGRDDNGSMRTYDDFRRRIRELFGDEQLPASLSEQTFGDGMRYQLAQRNTPALFGSGLIDEIPPATVRAIAEKQRDEHPALAGQVADAGAGRFGWRGHISSLEQFVRTACVEELGLQVKKARTKGIETQPVWPVEGARSELRSTALDLSEKQVHALIAYVRSLPAPRQILPESFNERVVIDSGRQRFHDLGCAVCHVEDVGPAKGIFSDLLLHRMGSAFADRVAAPFPPPQFRRVTTFETAATVIRGPSSGGGGGYSGGGGSTSLVDVAAVPSTQFVEIPPSLGELEAATEAFRTPPLWGVADSAPYLHDGRADTLDEAIREHDGQARESAEQYGLLDDEARGEVLAFLETLKAPVEE